jgi:hypothetical protein
MAKKRGRPAKAPSERVEKIKISITKVRLAKVDQRGSNRSAVIGQMIDSSD